jgi:AcrR family transcriptional regulator
MLLRTSGASRLNIAKLVASATATAAAKATPLRASSRHHRPVRSGTTTSASAGSATTSSTLARNAEPRRSRASRCVGLHRVGEHRRVHHDAVGEHEVLRDAGGDEDRDPERFGEAPPGDEHEQRRHRRDDEDEGTGSVDGGRRGRAADSDELAPEREVADDGEPERECRARRARGERGRRAKSSTRGGEPGGCTVIVAYSLAGAALANGFANCYSPSPSKQLLCSEMTASPRTNGKAGNDNRRSDLVRAAAQLFRQKGFDGTTIRDIAGAVGMRSGSPFYHFASKHELLLAVMEEGLRLGLERTRAVVDEPGIGAVERFPPSRPRALRHPPRDGQRLHPGDALRLAVAAAAAPSPHRRAEGPLRRDLAGIDRRAARRGQARRRCAASRG